MQNLAEEIRKIIYGDVAVDPESIQRASNDASIFEVRPKVVVYPKSVDDIRSLVHFVDKNKLRNPELSLTVRAAGTGMSGGSLSRSIILDITKYLNKIIRVDEVDGTVQPGAYYRDFEKETLKYGVIMPAYPASKNICAIGGMVANNAGGEKSLSYGSTVRYVKSLRAVLSDGNEYSFGPISKTELDQKIARQDFEGEIYRKTYDLIVKNENLIKNAKPNVSKNSTGYFIWDVWNGETFDLSKLFVASQGTLGIITETTFQLLKPKVHRKMLLLFIKKKDFKYLGEIVNKVLEFKPESFESYEDHTFSIAIKYFGEIVKTLHTGMIKLAFQFLPEFWMILTQGMPKLVLIAEFTGDTITEAERKAYAAQKTLTNMGYKTRMTKSPADAEKYWAIRHESFNLLRKHIKKERTAPFIDDLIVRPEQLPEFLPRLNALLDDYKLTFTIAGHIGDANFHIMPLMDFTKEESKKTFAEITDRVFDLVFEFKGSLAGEHNDGIVRTPYLRKQYGDEVYAIFEEVKRIFDPHNIFNPGKKVGGTWDYTMEHIDTVY